MWICMEQVSNRSRIFSTRMREGNVFSHVCMSVQRWGSRVTTTQDAIGLSQDTWRIPPTPTRPVQTCLLGATPGAWLSPLPHGHMGSPHRPSPACLLHGDCPSALFIHPYSHWQEGSCPLSERSSCLLCLTNFSTVYIFRIYLSLPVRMSKQECIPVGCVPSATVAICFGGGSPHPPHPPRAGTSQEQTPQSRHIPPPEQAPLEQAPPPGADPSCPPVARHAGIPPAMHAGIAHPPAARHAGIPPAMHAGIAPPPVNRTTDTCKK